MSARAPRDLVFARALTLGAVVVAFPLGTWLVFGAGADRRVVADGIAWTYSLGLFAAFTTSFWPLGGLRDWTRARRMESAALLFLLVSYATHLSWELGWLVAHDAIAAARDAPWAYAWWAYIDGGDARYAAAPAGLLAIETLSVVNGSIGVLAFVLWLRSRGTDPRAVGLFMATAVVHLYSASLYYLTEILDGLPSVDRASFTALWIKFGLANAPWVTMPWVVLAWGARKVRALARD